MGVLQPLTHGEGNRPVELKKAQCGKPRVIFMGPVTEAFGL